MSHSACGNSTEGSLSFDTHQYALVNVEQEQQAPFFAMKGAPLSQSEERLYVLLFSLLEKLIEQAGLTLEELAETPLLLGSTSLDISIYQPQSDQAIWLPPSDTITRNIVEHFGLNSFHYTINTACTASLNALLYGKKLLKHKGYKQVLVIGCEFFNELTLGGFHSLDLISPKRELTAFSEQRDGLILGEGIGAVLLSADQPAEGPCLEILEGYSSCDTHSLTTTQEDGSQILHVIDKALTFSGLTAADIDLIKVHGTATMSNDQAESNALVQEYSDTPIFGLKPFIGHTLGACGLIELAMMNSLLQQDSLPIPSYAQQQPEQQLMAFAPAEKPLTDYRHILVNHCGFGGNNSALIIKVADS